MIGAMIAGSAVGGAMGIASGALNNAANKKMMEEQFKHNEQMAVNNQQRNKEMWDYTNYENQRKHMENAGLNPALMYGQGGGGGTSTSGGSGQGVGMAPSTMGNNTMAGAQMGMQLAQMQAQVKNIEADTKVKEVQAEKTAGVDTELVKNSIENLAAQTKNEYERRDLIRADTQLKESEAVLKQATTGFTLEKTNEVRSAINRMGYEMMKMSREIDGLDLDVELKRRTIDNRVKESQLVLDNIGAEIFMKSSQGGVNVEQAKGIVERVKQQWQEIGIKGAVKEQGWRGLEIEAEKVMNNLRLQEKGLDIKDSQLTKDWVLGVGRLLLDTGKVNW